jgi:hypothetical protein
MNAQTAGITTPAFSAAELDERAVRRRAAEAVVWGIPAVNYLG